MKKQLLVLGSLFALVSCASNSNSITSSILEVEDKGAHIEVTSNSNESLLIKPEDVVLTESLHSICSKRLFNTNVLPSTGDVNILAIPMLLPGYEKIDVNHDGVDDKNKIVEDLGKAFFADENDVFESVSSFYKKSSFNKLNIKGKVTKWFDVAVHTKYKNAAEIDVDQTYDVVASAVKWCSDELYIDLTKYDNDKDGYIDGIWCIYSAPNYANGGPRTDYQNYWAYTAWGNQSGTPNLDKPVHNLFGWASYDFMYEGYGVDKVDAHTFIHETGHFLGLNDYYSDDFTYNPIGKLDMMDMNVIDHNAYTKMLLGWSKPYIVKGNASIDIKSMKEEDSFVVVLSDNQTISNNEFDPFDEYMLLEDFTTNGLNYHDIYESPYGESFNVKEEGVKVYHIDNRKYVLDVSKEDLNLEEYDGQVINTRNRLVTPITNNRNFDTYNYYFNFDLTNNLYDEIRLIEQTNVNTFSYGGKLIDASLFREGDEFSLAKYGAKFFINEDKFDNGDTFSSTIKIGGIK
ncbi:MAG: hypothetical protein MJ248_00095 [Bacilli bacterium]|nr:hypothetical protein [Bacilli bacterium]